MTPNFAVIAEAKNIAGKLTYDPTFNQLNQNHNGKVKRISDPFAQVTRQRNLLIKWLENHNVYSLPFEFLVVNTNPRTILEANSNNHHIAKHFLHVEHVPISVKNFTSVYKDPIFNARESHQLSTLLVNSYQPASIDILEEYSISKNELLQGSTVRNVRRYQLNEKIGSGIVKSVRVPSKMPTNKPFTTTFI